jgi:hypothetical protein
MPGSTVEPPRGTEIRIERRVLPSAGNNEEPMIFGLFGIDGTGKNYLLSQLEKTLGEGDFAFYDISKLLLIGGLHASMKLSEHDGSGRELASERIKRECTNSGKNRVVVGHYICWEEDWDKGNVVYTKRALNMFTHILYVNTLVEVIVERREDGPDKERSVAHLARWQEEERTRLQGRCRESNIPFTIVPLPDATVRDTILALCNATAEPQQSS